MTPCPLYVTLGDPAGIGPEVALKALAAYRRDGGARPARVYGTLAAYDAALAMLSADDRARLNDVERHALNVDAAAIRPGEPGAASGHHALAALWHAITGMAAARGPALVTAPVSKAALQAAQSCFLDHTTLLGGVCGRAPIMSFVGGGLRVALATVHIPLMQVAARLDGDALTRLILIASWQMAVRENLPGPVRVAVCGVNPHAGEGGLMGDEDDRIVRPAIERARRGDLPPELSAASAGTVSVTHDGSLPPLARIGSSHDATAAQAELIVSGPLPADTVFHRARQGDFDVVIAMYH
ncbi:MAG: PdxA family protein, partial [Planctomycetota bacterium]